MAAHMDTINQLKRMKAQRSREREMRDFEERMLLDELEDTNRRLKGSPRVPRRSKLHLSKNPELRGLQIKYEREREREVYGEPKRDYRRRQVDHPRYNPQSDPKVKQLAENHGRSMEMLHSKNRDLERQREEIRRRLEDLGRRPIKDDDSMNALLQELRDQDARNKRLLEELRRQLMDARYVPPPVLPPPAPAPIQTERGRGMVYPIFFGNSLVSEIAAVRQAYIHNGGSDPDILQQLAQMQAEAQAIDDSLKSRPAPKHKDTKPNDHFLSLELENERLQRQLLLLQEQNLQAKQRRKDNREDELERDIRRMQQDHLRKMYELQREIEHLRHESMYLKYQDKPSKIIVHSAQAPAHPPPAPAPAPAPQQPVTTYVDVDRLAPYDYSPRQPYAHTWAKTQYRQDANPDPFYELRI